MKNATQFHIRPARPEEAGLFYTPHPEEDKRLGTVGHVRMDFGRSGNEFWHTWWPRGPEELNSPAFKAELQEVVDTLRESVLKSRFAMERFCYEHGGKINGGYVQNYGYIVETAHYRYCLRCNPSPGDYNAYLTAYDLDVQRQNMAQEKLLIGRVTYANGDAQEFTDADKFLRCVQEELPYDSTLYEGGASLSTADNILRVGRELGLCSDDADTNALVTRGEAAIILHAVLTQSLHIEEPPAPVTLVNAAGVNVNDFLLELRKVPEQVLDAFNAAGWTYCIDFDYMGGLSKKLNMSCIGATNYSQKTIYLSDASATLHEFGHFLDGQLGFPVEHEHLYLAEAQNSGLWDYAKTNAREYFADCFAYCIIHGNDSEMMKSLRKNAPQTCTYFEELGKDSWSRSIRSK